MDNQKVLIKGGISVICLNEGYDETFARPSYDGGIDHGSVDMIFADLPYNITQARFDGCIPMEDYIEVNVGRKKVNMNKREWFMYYHEVNKYIVEDHWEKVHKKGLWSKYDRLLEDNGVVVLTAAQPFTSYLVTTARECGFKLQAEWIWEKTQATGHLNAKRLPMKAHESVLIFVKQRSKGHTYNPQKTEGHTRKVSSAAHKRATRSNQTELYGKSDNFTDYDSTTRYPRTVLRFKSDKQTLSLHPTQKPLSLVEYFIRTYSNPNDLILDNVAGSLTTAEAALNTGRNCIAIESDEEYFKKGLTRFSK